MNWKIFFLKFFRNILICVVLGALALGLFGYWLAGQEGFINGAYWGAVLGLIGGCFSSILILARFWGDPGRYQMFPEYYWFVKKDEDGKPRL